LVNGASFEVVSHTTVSGLSPHRNYLLKIRITSHSADPARYIIRVNGDAGSNYQYTVRWTTADGVSGGMGSGSGMVTDHGLLSPAGADCTGVLASERWSGDIHISTAHDKPSWTYIRQDTIWDFTEHTPYPYCADVSGVIRYHGSASLSSIEIGETGTGEMSGEWELYEYR